MAVNAVSIVILMADYIHGMNQKMFVLMVGICQTLLNG